MYDNISLISYSILDTIACIHCERRRITKDCKISYEIFAQNNEKTDWNLMQQFK